VAAVRDANGERVMEREKEIRVRVLADEVACFDW